jgi:DNA-binding NtrC family response regulator
MAASVFESATSDEVPPLGRALLVDDEPELRRLLRRTLVRAGFEVVEAADGRAALEAARLAHFDVVISDVRMPRMGGLELLERLQLEEPGLPVVLISGSAEVLNRQSAVDVGAFDYLAKPIELGTLQSVALSALTFRHGQAPEQSGANGRVSCERLLSLAPEATSRARK